MKKRLLQASVPLAGSPLEASMTLYDHKARRSVTLMPVLKVSCFFRYTPTGMHKDLHAGFGQCEHADSPQ